MAHRLPLDRVHFREPISRPPNRKGTSPGKYYIFSRDPDAGKTIRSGEPLEPYDLWLQDDGWIVIRSRETAVEEWVSVRMATQVRPQSPAAAK